MKEKVKRATQMHIGIHRLTQVITERTAHNEELATVCSCVVLERLSVLIPAAPCPLVGAWQGRPPSDSAEAVLWKVAALLKFDPETRFVEPEAYRPIIGAISQLLNIDDDDGWGLFFAAYKAATNGTGASNEYLQVAKLNAQESIDHGTDREYIGARPVYRNMSRRLLVGIFHYLLRDGKPGERFLSSRDAGTLIGVHYTQAAKWIRAMVADGYLERIETEEADQQDDHKPKPRLPPHLLAPLYRWIYC